MHARSVRERARQLVAEGASTVDVAAQLDVSQAAVWRWAHRALVSDGAVVRCFHCEPDAGAPVNGSDYCYLLGQYLGDGHLVTSSWVPVLRISMCTDYPRIVDEVRTAITRIRGSEPGRVRPARAGRMINVQSYWMHWPCLFPQHGPGRKHERPIVLAAWQRDLVTAYPWSLIRGLIHSDGCRSINRVTVRGRTYEYPRYLFANESRDILVVLGDALDLVGVRWRYNQPNSISVARRESVALMEQHVGPKT